MECRSKALCLAFTLTLMTIAQGSFRLLASPQASNSMTGTAISLKVPVDTAFLATLTTPIVPVQAKGGDAVEAQTIQDIKQGNEIRLKKGWTLLGHVDSVEPMPSAFPEQGVVIVFDRVRLKKGDEVELHLVVQALAPKSDVATDSVPFATGRGMQSATADNLPSGHASATRGSVNPLTPSSHGVQDLRGLELSERIVDGKHFTVLSSSRRDIQLKKGAQLAMKVVSQ